jgi:hypothetical protein
MRALRIFGFALAAAALLSSCGKKDSAETGGAGVASAPMTYLFFTGGANAALGAVDPANATPAGLITVEPSAAAINSVNPIYAGNYDATMLQITGVHHHAVTYFKDVGGGTLQLFKVNALTGAAPAPVRVSSASFANSGATALCSVAVYSDYANPDNSRVVYTQAGVDAGCSTADDPVLMATLSMSSATSPVAGPVGARVIRELRDNGGAIAGWIMLLGANLRWYQADMASGTSQLLTASVTSVNYLAGGTGKEFLAVNTGSGPQVRIFDGTATLKNPGNSATALPASFDCKADDTYLFCADVTATGRTIRRLPLDGSATWTAIYTGFSETMTGIVLSQSRVLFKDTSTSGQLNLFSVPKVPFDPTFVFPDLVCRFAGTGDEQILASGPRVYCSEAIDSPTRARHVHEDGEDEVLITDASATLLVWGWQSGSTRAVNEFQKSERLLLMGQTGAGVNRLTSYDGPSGLVLADLMNTVLAGFSIQLPTVLADANNGNTLVTLLDGGGFYELFFANTATANSLVRLTSTAGNSESFVGASGCTLGSGQAPDPLLPLLVIVALVYIWRRRGKRVR